MVTNGDIQQRSGACHCGAVKFAVMLPLELRGARCDCSICAMKGAVTVGAPLDGLTVFEGKEFLTLYQFNTNTAKHFFCSKCGSYTFHQRRSDPNTYGVNVACLGLNPYHDFPDVAVSDGLHHVKDSGKARLAGRLKFEENPD
jgi:hypothetical protein